MLHDLLIGISGSIIGAIICAAGGRLYFYLKLYKDSEYSGVWEDVIPAKPDGSPEKHDEFIIKHNKRTNTISGDIKRTFPSSQTTRNWKMNGVIDDGYFIASFWHDGPQKSNGCIYAKLMEDNRYDGYYLEEHNGVIDQTAITLKKKG